MNKPDREAPDSINMNNYSGDIVIYPSSWYYNACVHGFLEMLAWGLGEEGKRIIEEQLLQNDGRAVIPSDLAQAIFNNESVRMPDGYNERPVPKELKEIKRIVWWWAAAGYEAGFMRKNDRDKPLACAEIVDTVCGNLFYFQYGAYPNLAQPSWNKQEFLNNWFVLDKRGPGNVICSFCGQEYISDVGNRIFDVFFTRLLSTALGNGPDVFPNRFWNGNPSLTMCKKCRSYFLCFHFVQRNRFFINSNSLRVNWYLNQLIAGKLRQNRFAYQAALLDSLQFDPQLRGGIGAWGLQNLEVLILERNKISYYPLSPNVTRMFLVPQISSLISKLSNLKLWDTILGERFEYLPTVIYKSLRVFLTKDNSIKDPEVVYNSKSIQPIVDLITLYVEIIRFLSSEKGSKGMSYVNIRQLRNLGATAPLAQDDNLIFRLLELTRLNRKSDVYHLLLRVYVARKMEFPNTLAQVFSIADRELFKTGIYAYISGLVPGEKPQESSNQ